MNGFSIIIPACNEAAVIEHTLKSIMACHLDRPLEVIVVANGCTDDTAERARRFGPCVQVIETPIGNKSHALNLGDRQANFFPRAFLDADIDLSPNTLQSVVDAFNDPGCRIATPTANHVFDGYNPVLSGYYKLWRSLPHVRKAVMGAGFYAIDAVLRSRFIEFPALTADDKFIRNLARPRERRIMGGCYTTITMPRSFHALLKVKTRWTCGNLELAGARPDLNQNDQNPHQGIAGHLLLRPWLWIHVPAFLFVYLYTHSAARKRLADNSTAWLRDDSAHSLAPPARPAV